MIEILSSEPRSLRRPDEMNTSCNVLERSSVVVSSDTETGSEDSER